jgi:hypothetical protein
MKSKYRVRINVREGFLLNGEWHSHIPSLLGSVQDRARDWESSAVEYASNMDHEKFLDALRQRRFNNELYLFALLAVFLHGCKQVKAARDFCVDYRTLRGYVHSLRNALAVN